MNRVLKICAAVFSCVFLLGCTGGNNVPVGEQVNRAPLTHTLSGTPIPIVDESKAYLLSSPVAKAEIGKIVYTVNSESAGYVRGETVQEQGGASTEVTAVANIVTEISKAKPEAFTAGSW